MTAADSSYKRLFLVGPCVAIAVSLATSSRSGVGALYVLGLIETSVMLCLPQFLILAAGRFLTEIPSRALGGVAIALALLPAAALVLSRFLKADNGFGYWFMYFSMLPGVVVGFLGLLPWLYRNSDRSAASTVLASVGGIVVCSVISAAAIQFWHQP